MMVRTIALMFTAAACASSAPPKPAKATTGVAPTIGDTCPMNVDGTVVSSEPLPGGTALAFTTLGDVSELRRRVRLLVRLHEQRPTTEGVIASSEDVEGGARLRLRATDASQLESLQSSVTRQAERLDFGTCPALPVGALISWLVTEPDNRRDRDLTSR